VKKIRQIDKYTAEYRCRDGVIVEMDMMFKCPEINQMYECMCIRAPELRNEFNKILALNSSQVGSSL
jgi:hypothetical protein